MIVPVLNLASYSKDGKSMVIQDTTGTYAASTNPGGYGSPNAEEPSVIAMSIKYWEDTAVTGSFVTDSVESVANILSTGLTLTADMFGGTADTQFSPGVHTLKYYPLETKTLVVQATNGSKTVSVVSGADIPSGWNAGYIGIVFEKAGEYSKLYLIDRTATISASSFSLTEVFEGETANDYSVYIAPEADLKMLATVPANECLVKSIGEFAEKCHSNEADELTGMVMQMFAAQVDFNCGSFDTAHKKVYNIYLVCSDCKPECSCN